VLVSSRHPEQLQELARSLGPRGRAGTPREAAVFGDVVLVSVPYAALPQIGRDLAKELAGKIVLDTGNPYPERDGEMAHEARRKGTGIASAEFLPGVRLVRAFNAIGHGSLRSEAHRAGKAVAIPIAGDDGEALRVAARLVKDAGFEPAESSRRITCPRIWRWRATLAALGTHEEGHADPGRAASGAAGEREGPRRSRGRRSPGRIAADLLGAEDGSSRRFRRGDAR
jgi:predicted dinucleotide-binding enzyme